MAKNELVALDNMAQVEMTLGSLTIVGYDELKQAIENEVSKYDNLVIAYTDKKSIKTGKEVQASLNKIVKQVDDYRKQYKVEYLKPLNDFESQLNELKAIAQNGVNNIKTLLSEVEVQRKADRRKEVEAFVEELSEGFNIPFNEKWLNATAKDTDIRTEIIMLVEQEKAKQKEYETNVAIIKSFAETYGQQAEGWIAQLEYVPILEIQKRMKEAHDREVEKQKAHEELTDKNNEVIEVVEEPTVEIVEVAEEKEQHTLHIELGKSQLDKLLSYLETNHITYSLDSEVYADDDLPW